MKPHSAAVQTARVLFGPQMTLDKLTLVVREWFRLEIDRGRVMELMYLIQEEGKYRMDNEEQLELWEEEEWSM